MYTYEDKQGEVDELLSKMRSKWQLDSIQWMDYNDVCQIIRKHIWDKWDLWDQERSFKPWCRTVISHQISNLIRNNYRSFARPCLNCPHNMGADTCDFTKSKIQDSSCADYAKWKKKRSHVYNLKLPVPIEDKMLSDTIELHDEMDFEVSADNLHVLVMAQLTDRQREVYRLLYIEKLDDKDVAEQMGFTPDGNKSVRYKQLTNLKKRFVVVAKIVLENNDVIK